MLFSEAAFFVFFSAYLFFHFLVPSTYRVYLVIAGSTVFYAWWRIDYLWVPYSLTLIAWYGVRWIEGSSGPDVKRQRLTTTLIVLFLPLIIVKYTYFFTVDVAGPLVGIEHLIAEPEVLLWALPLGISFITFTVTAYIVDVYRGRYRPEDKLSRLLAYVLFFPHLIAGPILRPHELLPQLKKFRDAFDAKFTVGVAIFTLGLVKKLVFADQIADVVDPIFADGADPTGWQYLLGIYGFSVQIYCDFSGYTDMAVGLAYILRIRLPTNFRRPYSASSIVEFWRCWHITLSSWLRDYLYIPLGGSRSGRAQQFANAMITMTIGGLWHGANWTFVIWGGLHGLAIGAVHFLRAVSRGKAPPIPKWLCVVFTFHFVTLAWVYFRAPNVSSAHRVLSEVAFDADWSNLGGFISENLFPLVLIIVFLLTHRFDQHARLRLAARKVNKGFFWPFLAMAWVIAITVSQGNSAKFIYFDF